MVDLSIIGGTLFMWMQSGLFWLLLTVILTMCGLLLLWWKKRTRLKYTALEIVSFGNGKVGINKRKAGLFKRKTALFGLWDYGSESVFKTDDGRVILECSTDDLHDIFMKKGFIVRRKDDDPKILVPVSAVDWRGERALFAIAPADFRDTSANLIKDTIKETEGWADKYLPYIMLGGIVLFFIIAMILATQFFNRTVDKAGEILKQAGSQAGTVQASTGAP